ncbi:hypothetical protein C8R43DRAFT_1141161 [Mycena crocata]|nr:hypothetical protein C8R43DRAFT_1141161 [Mycena crocata]
MLWYAASDDDNDSAVGEEAEHADTKRDKQEAHTLSEDLSACRPAQQNITASRKIDLSTPQSARPKAPRSTYVLPSNTNRRIRRVVSQAPPAPFGVCCIHYSIAGLLNGARACTPEASGRKSMISETKRSGPSVPDASFVRAFPASCR